MSDLFNWFADLTRDYAASLPRTTDGIKPPASGVDVDSGKGGENQGFPPEIYALALLRAAEEGEA